MTTWRTMAVGLHLLAIGLSFFSSTAAFAWGATGH